MTTRLEEQERHDRVTGAAALHLMALPDDKAKALSISLEREFDRNKTFGTVDGDVSRYIEDTLPELEQVLATFAVQPAAELARPATPAPTVRLSARQALNKFQRILRENEKSK
jgi:hypothetical protein